MKKINPNIDTFHGINNALNPCSPQYRQGMAYDAQNSRINESGIWDKAPSLSSVSLGSASVTGLPVSIDIISTDIEGCVSYYKFEETSGTAISDYYENNDGTASNEAILHESGKIDRCINCDGQYHIVVPDDDSLSFANNTGFSFSVWIYVPETISANGWVLYKQDEYGLLVGTSRYMQFFIGGAYFTTNPTTLTTGWHHIVAVRKVNTGNDTVYIYIDGVNAATTSSGSNPPTATANDLYIGSKAGSEYYPDKIDSLSIYNRALEENEILQIYNDGDGLDDQEESICPHYKEATILDSKYIVKYMKYNTTFAVGTNKYAYFACDNMGTSRSVYEWNGTDKASAAAFVDNETSFDYSLAGMGRPTEDLFVEENAYDAASDYGGRQEKGRYYYMFTWYDSERKCESLPSPVKEYDSSSWISTYETCKFPFVSVKPEVQASAPSSGSPRYDTNTKVRIYRTKRTYSDNHIVNPPNDFYFIDEIDYSPVISGLSYDHSGGTVERKLSGTTGDFTGVSVGDFIYLYGATSGNVGDKVYQVAAIDETNAAYVQLTDDGDLDSDDTSIECSKMVLADYLNDNELTERYEGRGSPPPSNVDFICPFNNRMYYFIGNTVYWSSAGRPGEVAQEYTLTYKVTSAAATVVTSTAKQKPLLSTGDYGEAKYEIAELAGETIIAAYPWRNRLYIWTQEGTCGYLEGTYTTEGVRFYLLRKGIGVISDKTLAHTPYGLFGADREGIWQMDNNGAIFRISKGWIDINDSSKSTYAKQSTLDHSFGVWSPELEEYIWCVVNAGESTVCRQIAYNPLRRIFSGIYAYPSLFGGCLISTTNGLQNYLTNAKTFDSSSNEALEQTLDFWMGQHSLESVKDQIEVEIIYESVTADKDVTCSVYQNNIASTTGATSVTGITHNDDNLVGRIRPVGSGRMFLVRISIPSDCVAPIIAIGYIANHIIWNEKNLR